MISSTEGGDRDADRLGAAARRRLGRERGAAYLDRSGPTARAQVNCLLEMGLRGLCQVVRLHLEGRRSRHAVVRPRSPPSS
ncbi:hypothetical protein ACRAWF_21445 [Streptomyces sp. L7]